VTVKGHDRTEVLARRFREAFSCFDRFSRGALASAFGSVAHFVAQHRMKVRISEVRHDRRSFQFLMADNSYLLVAFAIDGIDVLECTSEGRIPSVGRFDGVRTTISLRAADRRWGEACLMMALDGFVLRCTEAARRREQDPPGAARPGLEEPSPQLQALVRASAG
jgi:hypothetical protein